MPRSERAASCGGTSGRVACLVAGRHLHVVPVVHVDAVAHASDHLAEDARRLSATNRSPRPSARRPAR
eukprot:12915490-Prorocentrum_lima.AAC.1